MSNERRRRLRVVLLTVGAWIWLGGCLSSGGTESESVAGPEADASIQDKSGAKPIQEIVAQSFVLKSFEALLTASQVSGELKSPPYTLFVPEDAAFKALPYWSKITKNRAWYGHMRELVLGHVHQGDLARTSLADDLEVPLLNGDVARISVVNNRPRVDGIRVIGDSAASDGTLYMLNRVREPAWARRSVLDIINSDARFSILAEILRHPSLGERRRELGAASAELTFFAPTNEALAGFDMEKCTQPECVSALARLVGDHLVGAVVPRRFTPTRSFTAKSGASLRWDFNQQSIACSDSPGSTAQGVVRLGAFEEEYARNGIVEPMDRLLCSDAGNPAGDFPRSPFVAKLAVIMVGDHTPDQRRRVERQIDLNQRAAADYYAVNSGGVYTLEGAKFGPYPYRECFQPTREKQCSSLQDKALRLAAAEWAGMPVSSCPIEVSDGTVEAFKKEFLIVGYSYIYDKEVCKDSAYASLGYPGNTSRYQWLTTRLVSSYPDASFDEHFAHELGHTLGLGHVRVFGCDMTSGSDVIDGNPANHCGTRYVAPHTVMGNGQLRHVTAPHKRYMGWLRSCEDVEAGGGSATYRLDPIESQCGLRSVRIPVPGAEKHNYYVEYRNPNAGPYAGYNERGDPLIRAVLVHLEDETDIREGVSLMGGPLEVGTSYRLPGGVGVRLIGFDEEDGTAVVEVSTPYAESLASCSDGTPLTRDTDGYRVQCRPVLPAALRMGAE